MTMLRATVNSHDRTEPRDSSSRSWLRQARSSVSCTTSSARARSCPVRRSEYPHSAAACSSCSCCISATELSGIRPPTRVIRMVPPPGSNRLLVATQGERAQPVAGEPERAGGDERPRPRRRRRDRSSRHPRPGRSAGRRPPGPTPRPTASGCRLKIEPSTPSQTSTKSSPTTTACRVSAARREEQRGVDRAGDRGTHGQGPGPPRLRRVEHQGREAHRQRAEQHRGAPRRGELAHRDDVPVHRLREQVDDRAVVDLGAEHGRGGEQRDERQGQREPEPRPPPRARPRRR